MITTTSASRSTRFADGALRHRSDDRYRLARYDRVLDADLQHSPIRTATNGHTWRVEHEPRPGWSEGAHRSRPKSSTGPCVRMREGAEHDPLGFKPLADLRLDEVTQTEANYNADEERQHSPARFSDYFRAVPRPSFGITDRLDRSVGALTHFYG